MYLCHRCCAPSSRTSTSSARQFGPGTWISAPLHTRPRTTKSAGSCSGATVPSNTVSVTWETIAGVCRRLQLSLPPAWLCPETFCPPLGELDALRRRLRRIRDRTSDDRGLGATRLIESLVIAWLESTVTGREHRQPIRVRDRAIRKCRYYHYSHQFAATAR